MFDDHYEFRPDAFNTIYRKAIELVTVTAGSGDRGLIHYYYHLHKYARLAAYLYVDREMQYDRERDHRYPGYCFNYSNWIHEIPRYVIEAKCVPREELEPTLALMEIKYG